MRLFLNSLGPPVKNVELEGLFGIAVALAEEMDTDESGQRYIRTLPLEKELEGMDISSELVDFFRHLFVVNQKNRPSAVEHLDRENFSCQKKSHFKPQNFSQGRKCM